MSLRLITVVEVPDCADTQFDHGAFDSKTRRVFVAHTARNKVEVIDHDTCRHVSTLASFPEAAGVVAEQGQILVTNHGAESLAWIDGDTLETRGIFDTGMRPNGVAIVSQRRLAVVACIGDETRGPELQVLDLDKHQCKSIDLPGRPRWCVTDAEGKRVFLAIREPSMVLTAELPGLGNVQHWKLPSAGAHGIDIAHETKLLYVPVMAADSYKWILLPEEYSTSGRWQAFPTLHSSMRQTVLCTLQSAIPGWCRLSTRAAELARNSRQDGVLRRPR